ncbi:HIT family protein [Lentzea sp. NEAU-D13]|uniref:HIT family protein n=2 Tax=Lentzea alba TaxID=2714351 RepID=A0A7C9W225_9PSEU|nr:HIT family protein [Lentzea alba]
MACVFCSIMSGGLPAHWVAQAPDAVAFLPLASGSLAPGHTLVVPREHSVGVQDASPAAFAAAGELIQRVALAMEVALRASGVCVLNASGPGSEQSVPHLHFHVVPHWEDDEYFAWPEASGRRVEGDLAGALRDAIVG